MLEFPTLTPEQRRRGTAALLAGVDKFRLTREAKAGLSEQSILHTEVMILGMTLEMAAKYDGPVREALKYACDKVFKSSDQIEQKTTRRSQRKRPAAA